VEAWQTDKTAAHLSAFGANGVEGGIENAQRGAAMERRVQQVQRTSPDAQ
jgi:hypothetical protein